MKLKYVATTITGVTNSKTNRIKRKREKEKEKKDKEMKKTTLQ